MASAAPGVNRRRIEHAHSQSQEQPAERLNVSGHQRGILGQEKEGVK